MGRLFKHFSIASLLKAPKAMSREFRLNWFERFKPPFQRPMSVPLEAIPAAALTGTVAAMTPSEGGAGFPRFSSLAIGGLASRRPDGFAAARRKLGCAYTPAHPIQDRSMFAGRRKLAADMIRAVEGEGRHAILLGQRGIGKTSLLHVFAQAAREARYLVIYLSCGAAATFDETFRAVTLDIPALYHEDYGPSSPEAENGGMLADLLPTTPISPRTASDICGKIIGARVLIILDEFDRSESVGFRRGIGEFMKNLSDRGSRVQIVIAGVAGDLEELTGSGVIVPRSVLALNIPPMSREEIIELVRKGEDVIGLEFDSSAIDALTWASNGLPYVASLLSYHSASNALDRHSLTICIDDVRSAIARALDELKGRAPRRALIEIAKCERDGAGVLLGRLAGLAQTANGAFSLAGLETLLTDGGHQVSLARSLADRLGEKILFERYEDEAGNQFRFRDQTILPYLWLLAAQSVLQSGWPSVAPVLEHAKGGEAEYGAAISQLET